MGAVGATLNVDRLITLAVPQQQIRSPTLQASQVRPQTPSWLCPASGSCDL